MSFYKLLRFSVISVFISNNKNIIIKVLAACLVMLVVQFIYNDWEVFLKDYDQNVLLITLSVKTLLFVGCVFYIIFLVRPKKNNKYFSNNSPDHIDMATPNAYSLNANKGSVPESIYEKERLRSRYDQILDKYTNK